MYDEFQDDDEDDNDNNIIMGNTLKFLNNFT